MDEEDIDRRSLRTRHSEIERLARGPLEAAAPRGMVLQAKAEDRHLRMTFDGWCRVGRKVAYYRSYPAHGTMPVAILLREALECCSTLAYLPLNRARRYLALRGDVDDMRSERGRGADTPVAIAGGSFRPYVATPSLRPVGNTLHDNQNPDEARDARRTAAGTTRRSGYPPEHAHKRRPRGPRALVRR